MGEEKEKTSETKKKEEGGGKKVDNGSITVVLKVDLHCDGCLKKISRPIKRFEGVEKVTGDITTNKITVMGKVDPMKLKEWLESKIKKKVELISPQPKKNNKEGSGGGEKKPEDNPIEKKNKEPPVTTVVLKTRLHCQGCIERLQKIIAKFKGVQGVSTDAQKETVTVKGTMDVKSLQPYLQDKLKRSFDVVPPKKDDGEGDKKGKGSGGGGGEKKEKEGGGEKKEGEENSIVNKVEYHMPMYHGHPPGYFVEHVHAPQIFSDENPNACSVM